MYLPNAYKYISTVTSVNIDGKQVALYRVVVNKAASAGGLLTLTDTVSGAVIAVIDTTVVGTKDYGGVRVPGGITANATVAAADITIITG